MLWSALSLISLYCSLTGELSVGHLKVVPSVAPAWMVRNAELGVDVAVDAGKQVATLPVSPVTSFYVEGLDEDQRAALQDDIVRAVNERCGMRSSRQRAPSKGNSASSMSLPNAVDVTGTVSLVFHHHSAQDSLLIAVSRALLAPGTPDDVSWGSVCAS